MKSILVRKNYVPYLGMALIMLVFLFLTACSPKTTVGQDCLETSGKPSNLDLMEPGPYFASKTSYEFTDTERADRKVSITVWYPALQAENESTNPLVILSNRDPDFSGAPYPVILSSTIMASSLAPYMISHGFTWISVDKIGTYLIMNPDIYQQPLDILFALNKVAEDPPEGLEGMVNTDVAGAIGYSFDGNNSLVLSGARIDPDLYFSYCSDDAQEVDWGDMTSFSCKPYENWGEFSKGAGDLGTGGENGLWQPITDKRIRAFMPMAAEGIWLFDLSFIDRPVMMINGQKDGLYDENTRIFQSIGTKEKTFITILGQGHSLIDDKYYLMRLAHFANAFFGYHLQGCKAYADYFSQDFISQYDDMVWGVNEE